MNFSRSTVFLFFLVCLLSVLTETVYAGEKNNEDWSLYVDSILEELDFGELDEVAQKELPQKMTFGSLVKGILTGEEISLRSLTEKLLDLFFYEIETARPMFLQILSISLFFSVFGKMLMVRQEYVSELGFFAVYASIMMLLMQSFLLASQIVEAGTTKMLSFMTAFVPTYATTIFLTGNANSAGFFYELAFVMIYLLELLIKKVFLPGVHIYVLLEFIDNLFTENKLSRLADLLEGGIKTALKLSVAAVVGLGVVQSLLIPAKDRLSTSGVMKTLSAIPGVGNTFGATGELLLGCGILIKNSVGTAALVLLVVICVSYAFRIACFHVMYRFTGAMLQPFCDRRLGECVHGVGKACGLYLKIVVDLMLLFFITISMISASTSFIY